MENGLTVVHSESILRFMGDREILLSFLAVLVSRGGIARVPVTVFEEMLGKEYDILTKYNKSTKEMIFTASSNQQIN